MGRKGRFTGARWTGKRLQAFADLIRAWSGCRDIRLALRYVDDRCVIDIGPDKCIETAIFLLYSKKGYCIAERSVLFRLYPIKNLASGEVFWQTKAPVRYSISQALFILFPTRRSCKAPHGGSPASPPGLRCADQWRPNWGTGPGPDIPESVVRRRL